jgi:hypothetical protein
MSVYRCTKQIPDGISKQSIYTLCSGLCLDGCPQKKKASFKCLGQSKKKNVNASNKCNYLANICWCSRKLHDTQQIWLTSIPTINTKLCDWFTTKKDQLKILSQSRYRCRCRKYSPCSALSATPFTLWTTPHVMIKISQSTSPHDSRPRFEPTIVRTWIKSSDNYTVMFDAENLAGYFQFRSHPQLVSQEKGQYK